MTHPDCDHVPGCAGPGRCACICDPCIEREDAENERLEAEAREDYEPPDPDYDAVTPQERYERAWREKYGR